MSIVLKNGVTVGSANVSVIIGGVILTGIKSLSFNYEQEKGNVEGFQNQPIARERKLYKYSGLTMDILLEEWKAICLAAPNGDPMQIPMFDIPIVYDNNILPAETLGNAEFMKASRTYKSGDGAIWQVTELVFAGISQ